MTVLLRRSANISRKKWLTSCPVCARSAFFRLAVVRVCSFGLRLPAVLINYLRFHLLAVLIDYLRLHLDYKEPLFWIHLNMDYPFNMKGILYFPKINMEYESIEGTIKLYNNQVFIADNIKEVIPYPSSRRP